LSPVYQARSVNAGSPPLATTLAAKAWTGQLVLYVGAGLSRPAPTGMPTSAQLVDQIANSISLELGIEPREDGRARTLESLGDEAEASGALPALKGLLAAVGDFTLRVPNFGHEAVALLVQEKLANVLSVNWDTCIERAATALGAWVVPTVTEEDRRGRVRGCDLNKLYGCATRPNSLRVSTREIGEPATWAAAQVNAAMTSGSVVFIGLGTVPRYVEDAVSSVLDQGGPASDIVVVDPALSETWQRIASSASVGPTHVPMSGEPFLDDLLCAIVLKTLGDFLARGRQLAKDDPEFSPCVSTFERLADSLGWLPALPVLQWMRRGAGGIVAGQPFITDSLSTKTLLAMAASFSDGATVLAVDKGHTAAVSIDGCYVEFAAYPGALPSAFVDAERRRTDDLRASGTYADTAATVVHFCAGHIGRLPRLETVDDLVADRSDTSIVDVAAGRHRWVSVDSLLQGQFQRGGLS